MPDIFLKASWENIIMANYSVNPELLKPYLPKGVELDYYNNKTYISLVGFMFNDTSLFNIPIPFIGNFEEINLRFYVKRIEGDTVKRGVVFINETVPYKAVAWLAKKLYKEHYIAIPTKNSIEIIKNIKKVKYSWKMKQKWNKLEVNTYTEKEAMASESMEEYIFEHYYGYTKVANHLAQEYRVNHPKWLINKVINYSIDCDFQGMYGDDFSCLNNCEPESVIMAEGSPVSINWKRDSF